MSRPPKKTELPSPAQGELSRGCQPSVEKPPALGPTSRYEPSQDLTHVLTKWIRSELILVITDHINEISNSDQCLFLPNACSMPSSVLQSLYVNLF